MKKNFLVLLWMTLLPLAGWADNIQVMPANYSVTYGDADMPVSGSTATADMISYQGSLPEGVKASDVAALFNFVPIGTYSGVNEEGYSYRLDWKDADKKSITVENATHTVSITGGNGVLYVLKRPVTITATNAEKTFGEEDPSLAASITKGSMAGDEKLSWTVERVQGENASTFAIKVTVADDDISKNYEITTVDGTFTINPKSVNLVVADIEPVIYKFASWKWDDINPQVSYIDGETTITLTKDVDFTVADVADGKNKLVSNGGSFTVTPTGNYTGDAVTKTFEITKFPASDVKFTFKDTPYAYTGSAQTPVPAGTYVDVAGKSHNLSVAAMFDITYGEDNTNVGTVTVTLTAKNNQNVTGTATTSFEISKATLNAKVEGKSVNFGAELPTYTISYVDGLKGEDAYDNVVDLTGVTYTYEKDGETVENPANAGEYTVKATGATADNYDVVIADGTLTITAADIYILPNDAEKSYGGKDPAFTYTLVDATGAEVEGAALNGTVSIKRSTGENIGTYTIYVESYTANEEAADNYSPKNTYGASDETYTATFTIKAQEKALKLKFKEGTTATKVYGNDTPNYSIDNLEVVVDENGVSGLAGTDTWDEIKTNLVNDDTQFTLSSENVDDDNQITVTGLGSTNYPNVTVEPLSFTVTPRPFALTVYAQAIKFGKDIVRNSTDAKYWVRNQVKDEDNNQIYTFAFDEGKAGPGVVLYTATNENIKDYAIGEYTGEIKAKLTSANYELVEDACKWGKLTVTGEDELELLADNKDLAKIKAYDGQTDMTVKVTLKRENVINADTDTPTTYSWNQYDWNTMVLPFEVTVRELSSQLGYAIVNTYDEENETPSNAGFKLTMGTIEANTPFLVKTDADIDEGKVLTFENKTIVAPTESMKLTAKNGISFIGTYEDVVINKDNSQGQNEEATYWKYYAANAIKGIGKTSKNTYKVYPFTAYFNWTASAAGSRMTITVQDGNGNATTIGGIKSDLVNGEGWYGINGVKLNGAPTQKGIYINNGKKVVIK